MLFIRTILTEAFKRKIEKIKDGKASKLNENMRQFGLRIIFKTLFMSDEEKHDHHFDLPLFLDNNMSNSKQFLAQLCRGLSTECVQVSFM